LIEDNINDNIFKDTKSRRNCKVVAMLGIPSMKFQHVFLATIKSVGEKALPVEEKSDISLSNAHSNTFERGLHGTVILRGKRYIRRTNYEPHTCSN